MDLILIFHLAAIGVIMSILGKLGLLDKPYNLGQVALWAFTFMTVGVSLGYFKPGNENWWVDMFALVGTSGVIWVIIESLQNPDSELSILRRRIVQNDKELQELG